MGRSKPITNKWKEIAAAHEYTRSAARGTASLADHDEERAV
jgi:hypothetical protein